jgi:hypothetical protein
VVLFAWVEWLRERHEQWAEAAAADAAALAAALGGGLGLGAGGAGGQAGEGDEGDEERDGGSEGGGDASEEASLAAAAARQVRHREGRALARRPQPGRRRRPGARPWAPPPGRARAGRHGRPRQTAPAPTARRQGERQRGGGGGGGGGGEEALLMAAVAPRIISGEPFTERKSTFQARRRRRRRRRRCRCWCRCFVDRAWGRVVVAVMAPAAAEGCASVRRAARRGPNAVLPLCRPPSGPRPTPPARARARRRTCAA